MHDASLFCVKDFVETAEGLVFAVVSQTIETDRVGCFLRYVRVNDGLQKVDTKQANSLLTRQYPQYLFYSSLLDTMLHGVPISNIILHYRPKHRLQQLLQEASPDAVVNDLQNLCSRLQLFDLNLALMGVTGSVLIGAQNPNSDLDLVCYQRETFNHCRRIIGHLLELKQLQPLSDEDWQQSYLRRQCALSFHDYRWHEQRKCNKAMINGRKFDLSWVNGQAEIGLTRYKKCGPVTLQCQVVDDSRSFDYPAEFKIDHPEIDAVVSFTATYTGQALSGEWIEVSGWIESSESGVQRIVVGSSREATGEYIRVVTEKIH